jgi:hypothetical protein
MEYKEEAIPFIELENSQDGKFEFKLNPKSAEYLQKMTKKKVNITEVNKKNSKVAILTIAGPQRSGKSFLANRFLKKYN